MVAFVAMGAAAAAWFTPTPALDGSDAVDAAVGAMAAAGIEATPIERPERGVHTTDLGTEVDSWFVFLEVPVGGVPEPIELRVQRSTGQLVYVDDRIGPDDQERLLDDAEFRALADHTYDDAREDWVRRNAAASVGALVAAGTALVLARRPEEER